MKQVQVAVVGASGYTGQELLRILLNHRGVKLVCATSRQYAGQPLWEVFPRFRQVPGSGLGLACAVLYRHFANHLCSLAA